MDSIRHVRLSEREFHASCKQHNDNKNGSFGLFPDLKLRAKPNGEKRGKKPKVNSLLRLSSRLPQRSPYVAAQRGAAGVIYHERG